jgi:cytochrome c
LRLLAAASLTLIAACGGGSDGQAEPVTGASLGEQVFSADCELCHIAAPPDSPAAKTRRVGPNLYGVYGQAAAQGDFDYSKAMRAANLTWDEATLHAYLQNPQGVVRGTRMSFQGENDAARRQAVIDYLKAMQ